jgi:hypothetical protein
VNDRLEEIARRKQALVDRCAREREELSACFSRVRLPLNFGAVLWGLGRTLKTYPIAVAGISSLLVSGYGGKMTRSAGELLRLAQVVQPLWSWWSKHRKRK